MEKTTEDLPDLEQFSREELMELVRCYYDSAKSAKAHFAEAMALLKRRTDP